VAAGFRQLPPVEGLAVMSSSA